LRVAEWRRCAVIVIWGFGAAIAALAVVYSLKRRRHK
jgi:hypothetical protein